MADQLPRGYELEKKSNNLRDLYKQAANSYKLTESWDQAATAYNKLADCHLRMDSKHSAANSYVDAANCYKKISPKQAKSSLERVVELFSDLGRFDLVARYCKEVGEINEQDHCLEQAIVYFERACHFFESEKVTTSAIQSRQKVAQLSAQLQQYAKASEIFEEIARHSLHNNSLRYAVRGHLLNAGICHLCKGETVAITDALERYQGMGPSFSRTREYQLLADLAVAVDEKHVENFTDILKEYDSLSPLDAWKKSMLLRVKEALKLLKAKFGMYCLMYPSDLDLKKLYDGNQERRNIVGCLLNGIMENAGILCLSISRARTYTRRKRREV